MPRPDEGQVHAWLDGQLPPDEAARIEELVATDPEWAAAVAEARGLVAASSRILSALDRVPAGVVPKGTASHTRRMPWWTKIAAAVVVVVGGSVMVMQKTTEGPMSVPSIQEGAAQPTPDTSKVIVRAPVTSPPFPATTTPSLRARVPATGRAAAAPLSADAATGDVPALRREALAASPVTPPSTPTPSANVIAAEERKTIQDAARVIAEVSAAKALVGKAVPSAMQSTTQKTTQSIAPTAAPQARQATTQDLAQAQNAAPAQRVVGGVVAARRAQGQQAPLCYRLVPDSARRAPAVLMRAGRAAGDTLHLVPLESNVPQRAWIVWSHGMTGVLTTSGDLRRAVRVVATPATCPAP